MPLFKCSKCGCIEDTAAGGSYWVNDAAIHALETVMAVESEGKTGNTNILGAIKELEDWVEGMRKEINDGEPMNSLKLDLQDGINEQLPILYALKSFIALQPRPIEEAGGYKTVLGIGNDRVILGEYEQKTKSFIYSDRLGEMIADDVTHFYDLSALPKVGDNDLLQG